jgi:cytochrome c556
MERNMRWWLGAVWLALAPGSMSKELDPVAMQAYRASVFTSMASHMKAAGFIAKGMVDVSKEDRLLHAEALHESSAVIGGLFPVGTGPGDVETGALEAIWSDREAFDKAVKNYASATSRLVKVARTSDSEAYKAELGKVGKACGGCHDAFREKTL